jgi:single-stranded DNA-binding protein
MNHTLVSGKLGRDMDLRAESNSRMEGEISVAVNDYIGSDEVTGDPKYWLTWVSCVIRGNRARALQDQLYKGRFVVITGQLRTRNYKLEDGKTLPLTYVLVDHIEFDPKAQAAHPAHPNDSGSSESA